jgi:hypothetical protein
LEELEEYRRRTGCNHIAIGFGGGMSGRSVDVDELEAYEEIRAMIEQFGREVIPAFSAEGEETR